MFWKGILPAKLQEKPAHSHHLPLDTSPLSDTNLHSSFQAPPPSLPPSLPLRPLILDPVSLSLYPSPLSSCTSPSPCNALLSRLSSKSGWFATSLTVIYLKSAADAGTVTEFEVWSPANLMPACFLRMNTEAAGFHLSGVCPLIQLQFLGVHAHSCGSSEQR